MLVGGSSVTVATVTPAAWVPVVCSALCLDVYEFHLCLKGRGREDHFEEAKGTRIDGKSDDVAVK